MASVWTPYCGASRSATGRGAATSMAETCFNAIITIHIAWPACKHLSQHCTERFI